MRFPYAVLEVKLNLEAGKREPAWVRELMNSHLVSCSELARIDETVFT
jgi:SPX domain protein involved in polyphosphate accumulation